MCHYRKVARKHDFELVDWHRLKLGVLQDQMTISFSDIELVESNVLPKLIILAWDIECGSKRGPGFFSVAEQPDNYIYMIQLDIFLYNQSQPLKQYNITLFPINTSLFFEKYGNEISYIEIGYNTGGFDWPFVLKKAELLGISDEFSQQFLGKKSKLIYNIQETKVHIKVNPIEKQTCEYFYIQGLIFIDLLVWAKKTFQNELKHTLAHILKKCKLSGKIDLSYIPDDNSDNLKCIFVYVLAIKFKNDELLLSEFATKLSKLCKIDYQKCFDVMSDSSVLEEYAIDLAYYCSVNTLRLQELLIKRNIVGDYMQLAKISCITISNVFMNAVGTILNNFFGRNAQKQDMLFSMMHKGIIEIVSYEGVLVLEKKNSSKPIGILIRQTRLNIVTDNGKIYGKFLSQEQRIGLMPLICKELLRQCNIAKGKIKEYKEDPVLLMYWTLLSNALKLVANSIYGATGFIYSNLYMKPIASSIMAYSRLKDFLLEDIESKYTLQHNVNPKILSTKQIVYDTILKYICQEHELDLFVLNAKYNSTNKPVSIRDFFNSKHVEKSQENKMVIDFIAKRNEEGKKDLEPERFYYYIITHPNSNINIGRKMQLVSEFKNTDKIDKLYYFKNLKDICVSFFACSAKAVAEKIELFYKEQIDLFKQTTISFPVNASRSLINKHKSEIQPTNLNSKKLNQSKITESDEQENNSKKMQIRDSIN
ncbi:hypothetical protein C2G38_2231094 [Gigaspora rosea]|uniref:DNA polymerase delta catalytic subunit n=1 Tax=Gigaspora rosea TaxID=44941 RepID=A0A397TT93_9GLOM|nr:hypothetical protein C2G38_2231094 [Gigaspora rosea]